MSLRLSFLLLTLFFFSIFVLALNHTARAVLSCFAMMVISGVMWLKMYFSSFPSYMIFLLYVGGLLVLVIYLVMMSTNYYNVPAPMYIQLGGTVLMIAFCFVMLRSWGMFSMSLKPESASLAFHHLSLVFLGLLLFHVFVNVCTILCSGGRAVEVGKSS